MTGGMMFKGTPGPWDLAKSEDGCFDITAKYYDDDNHPWEIATVIGCAGPGDATRPNAHLIAAAPELLEELIRMANDMDSLGYDVTHARAAIAKALGEQK